MKNLADRCKTAGMPNITAPVITNLETRRKPGREITAEELVALARVLDVPASYLLTPFGDEELQLVPGETMGPLGAVSWLTDESSLPALYEAGGLRDDAIERMLRYRDSPLTVLRLIGTVTQNLAWHDRLLNEPAALDRGEGTATLHKNRITVLSIRLLHLIASLQALGYEPPPLTEAKEIMARHEMPLTLAELEAESEAEEGPMGRMHDS